MMGHYITYDGTLHNIGDLIWLDKTYHMIHTVMMGHYITYDGTLHNIGALISLDQAYHMIHKYDGTTTQIWWDIM